MPLDMPFTLGPFTVDGAGRLSPGGGERFPAFSLRWRGRPADVVMERVEGGTAILSLSLRAGFVCSTADDAAERSLKRRERAFAVLRLLGRMLPEGWRMELGPDHAVRLLAPRGLRLPATAEGLLTDLTVALLTAGPYLELLGEEGVGSAKT